jgi:hypothetical protein
MCADSSRFPCLQRRREGTTGGGLAVVAAVSWGRSIRRGLDDAATLLQRRRDAPQDDGGRPGGGCDGREGKGQGEGARPAGHRQADHRKDDQDAGGRRLWLAAKLGAMHARRGEVVGGDQRPRRRPPSRPNPPAPATPPEAPQAAQEPPRRCAPASRTPGEPQSFMAVILAGERRGSVKKGAPMCQNRLGSRHFSDKM